MSDNVQLNEIDAGAPEAAPDLTTGFEPAGAAPLTIAGLAPAALLAACGGSGGSPSPIAVTPTPTPTATTASISAVQASRFLAQSTMGATRTLIADVQARSYDGWLTAQFALPRATAHWDWLVANGYSAATFINNEQGFDPTVWRQMIVEPDQLRQRVGIALSEMLVVGIAGVNLNWKQFAAAAYLDVLLDNAFGNFRTILDRITTNAAMASFLTFLGNRRANAATGAVPDENYARELMQLFTLGVNRLNLDGTVQMSGGVAVETYTQADVSGLARIFTGLSLDSTDSTTPDRYRRVLVMNAGLHETGASTFLGTTVPAGTDGITAIRIALDTIFAHPNVPPFVSRQLIQRLVTSNPSPAYVGRVAAVFANDGTGTRGDMRAVLRAILLDSEARADTGLTATGGGKLREPVIRLTGWARMFGAASPSNAWAIGDTSSTSTRLGQSIGRSSSVFNFFRPGYTPPNSPIANAGLVAPELQITNELSVVAYVNYMQALIQNGTGDFRADYTAIVGMATDSAVLVDEINTVLASGQLTSATVTTIRAAVDSISATTATGPTNRALTAILLTLASPDFITLK